MITRTFHKLTRRAYENIKYDICPNKNCSNFSKHGIVRHKSNTLWSLWRVERNDTLKCTKWKRQFSTSKKEVSIYDEWKKYQFPTALGLVCLVLVGLRRKTSEIVEEEGGRNKRNYENLRIGVIIWGIPYRWMSHLWGKLTNLDLQVDLLKKGAYKFWTVLYDCKLEEMRYPLEAYRSLAEFFLRPLKDGARQIDSQSPDTIVSPCDAVVLHTGSTSIDAMKSLSAVFVEQVKGVNYSVEELLGREPDGLQEVSLLQENSKMLQYIVLYLAPGDYHHFHSPADWKVTQRRHFPGDLIPVRPWAVERIPGLYCKNERVVLNGKWKHGYFGFVAVGALNVGSIHICFDEQVKTNQDSYLPDMSSSVKCFERNYPFDLSMVRGQPVGSFRLGSTIVLLFETPRTSRFIVNPGDAVKVGQAILRNPSSPIYSPTSAPVDGQWPGEGANAQIIEKLHNLAL